MTPADVEQLATLRNLLPYYVGLLRLDEWEITVDFAHQHALGDGYLAKIYVRETFRIAVIRILYPAEHPTRDDEDPAVPPQDGEVSMAHELLHLVLWAWTTPEGERNETDQEWALNRLAAALVTQRRADARGR